MRERGGKGIRGFVLIGTRARLRPGASLPMPADGQRWRLRLAARPGTARHVVSCPVMSYQIMSCDVRSLA